jgi:hypothetical protein
MPRIAEAAGLVQSQVKEKLQVMSEMENFPKSTIHASQYELDDDSLPKPQPNILPLLFCYRKQKVLPPDESSFMLPETKT